MCPPLDARSAAGVAAAALRDTLEHALASRADRVVLALDGRPRSWCPAGVDVVGQGTGTLADRLAFAWRHATGPAIQIGMDTPQVLAGDLDAAMATLDEPGVDAVLGPAADGGWWAVGFAQSLPDPRVVFTGLPAGRADTGRRQLARLVAMGLRVRLLEVRRDVDTWTDACSVADEAPHTRFAAAVRSVSLVRR
ncbi:MAG: TIGR04282 family arsenosugar biosynthesis glycosyltransferase [Acidimicrobiales bacterium]